MKLALRSCPVAEIVDGVFHQRLTNALDRATVDLAREQQWIKRRAEIVDNNVSHDARFASVGIDLNLGDVRAVRISRRFNAELFRRT